MAVFYQLICKVFFTVVVISEINCLRKGLPDRFVFQFIYFLDQPIHLFQFTQCLIQITLRYSQCVFDQ